MINAERAKQKTPQISAEMTTAGRIRQKKNADA